ncbi:MAG: hypothetical protein NZM15_04915 [Flavobacteriales bacterium]|nr:hypothetical protein [Flavobacteriales bacterium]MDW8432026.1 hypothetical protein [Flavobacteriales bacterium]
MHARLQFIFFWIFSVFMVLGACRRADQKNPSAERAIRDSLFLLVIRDTSGTFRGVDLGDERAVVEYLEGIHSAELKTRSTLIIRQDFPGLNCLYVRYTFLRDGSLAEIVADAYLEKISMGNRLADTLRGYYERRLGPPGQGMGVYSWHTKDATGQEPAILELKDESEEYGYGKVNMTLYYVPRGL